MKDSISNPKMYSALKVFDECKRKDGESAQKESKNPNRNKRRSNNNDMERKKPYVLQ